VLAEVVREASARFGDRPALSTPDGWTCSYRELDHLSDEVAVWLQRTQGIGAGSVVALAMPTSVEFLVIYSALAKLGAITAGINPHLTPAEQRSAVDACRPDGLITNSRETADAMDVSRTVVVELVDRLADVCRTMRVADEAPAVLPAELDRGVAICFTSGSTGQPKGALFRERQLRSIFELDTGGAWGGGAPSIIGTQFAHIGAMTKVPWLLAGGATLYALRKWRAEDVLRLTVEHRMATLNAGPSQVALILRQPGLDDLDLSALKAIIAGTAPSSPALIEEARRRLQAGYSVRYSSTECGGVGLATALDAPDEEALHTVGRPRPGVEAKIADEEGNPLPDGETGEVWLRSPAVMSEYYLNPEETAKTLVGGWLRTGDLGLIDDRGCYRLVGRAKEMYIRGGYNVFPLEVEAVLCQHPKVDQIAIVPRPDEVMGEVGVAVVVPHDPADAPSLDELRDFAHDKLARFKLPEQVRTIDALPLNATDKLDRRALARIVQG
jgi:acyl-CoA synthetase (AMP-forming)/AMP-acid ligase II